MKKRGAATQIPQDEQWLFNFLCFMSREEDVIQKETEPVHGLPNRPDCVEQKKEYDSFACEAGGGIFEIEK